MILDGGHHLVLWTAAQAAQGAGVTRNAIDVWIHRGQLRQAASPTGQPLFDDRHRMLFWATDVARLVEQKKDMGSGRRARPAPELPEDLATATWTLAETVSAIGVSEASVRRWITSGLLERANPADSGEAVYRVLDVARVEHSTRRRARRSYS